MFLCQYPDSSLWCVEETWCRKENRTCSCRRRTSGLLHRQESGDNVPNYIKYVSNATKNSDHHLTNGACISLMFQHNVKSTDNCKVSFITRLCHKFIHQNPSKEKELLQSKPPSRQPRARWRLLAWFSCIYFLETFLQNGRLNYSSCIEYHQI